MIWPIVAVVLGIGLTVISADKFVEGAANLATRLGMSHFLIGLTIVSVGTSSPELLVSAVAAANGSPSLALGNALGSNITNITLVLGATAFLLPLAVPKPLIARELPMLVIVSICVCLLAIRGSFDLIAGVTLLGALPLVLYYLVRNQEKSEGAIEITQHKLGTAVTLTIGSLLVLIGSSKVLVWGAVELARQFGVSELIIGLTIIAIGTSLPELAASVASALKNNTDMALGTVIGSNLFNFLGVIGLAAVISPFPIENDVYSRDLPWTVGVTVLLFLFSRFSSKQEINRSHGLLFLLLYVSYLWNILAMIAPNS